MSIKVMDAIWQHADVGGGALLVLLAMGDWANEDGTGVFAKQITIAKKARLSDRQVRNVLGELEAAEYIYRDGKHGHTVLWRVESDPEIIAGRKPISGSSGNPLPTEPSIEPPGDEASSSPTSPGTENDDPECQSKSSFPGAEKYDLPKTPGAEAAPWLVLELGRLMRVNDDKAKLPVAISIGVPHFERAQEKSLVYARHLLGDGALVAWHTSCKQWLDAMRLLIDTDGRDRIEVVRVLRWCQTDSFWMTNILSATKFRDQYPKLKLRFEETATAGPGRGAPTAPTSSQLDRMAGR